MNKEQARPDDPFGRGTPNEELNTSLFVIQCFFFIIHNSFFLYLVLKLASRIDNAPGRFF